MTGCNDCTKDQYPGKVIKVDNGKCVSCGKQISAPIKCAPKGQSEFAGSATPSDEVEILRAVIRRAHRWLEEYKNSENATYAKRMLAQAIDKFDGQ